MREHYFDSDPDAQLALASSIAQSDAREGAWAYGVLSEYLPLQPYSPTTEFAQRVQIAATAFMLERVSEPGYARRHQISFCKTF